MRKSGKIKLLLALGAGASALTGCGSIAGGPQLPQAPTVSVREGPGEDYMIGPLDQLTIFVWRNPELSMSVPVRPDGADLRLSKTKTPNPVALGSDMVSTITVTNGGPRVASGVLRVVAPQLLAGQVRGRVVVDVNA